jgi:hypothetical protein
VDQLFKGHKDNKQTRELKDEILSNLEAKVADLTANGTEYMQAVKMATQNINSVDLLIDGNKKVYVNKFRIELMQAALLYVLIAWIITTPLSIMGIGMLLNFLLLIGVVAMGIIYLALHSKKESHHLERTSFFNIENARRYRKMAWLIWGLFILASVLGNTAILFGSDIWFSRTISIAGPYQFAQIATKYALPVLSIFIPLLFNTSLKLIQKHEVSEQYESQK